MRDRLRALHNSRFCLILVIARSEATRQSRGLSMCYEIASLAPFATLGAKGSPQ